MWLQRARELGVEEEAFTAAIEGNDPQNALIKLIQGKGDVPVPPQSCRWWWFVGRIPHDPEEASPYLHVLRELENDQITAVITSDEFVEQEKMVSEHVDRGMDSTQTRIGKQFGLQRDEMAARQKTVDAQLTAMRLQIAKSDEKHDDVKVVLLKKFASAFPEASVSDAASASAPLERESSSLGLGGMLDPADDY